MMDQVTRKEFNGLGNRVNELKGDMRAQKIQIKRNEDDIQKIFENLKSLPYWMIGTILIPSTLILYQILTKK